MNVEIVEQAERRVATVTHVGPYNQIGQAFMRLGAIAGAAGLFDQQERPVMIAITAYSSDSDRRLAKAAGFNEFIAKPYDPAALLQRLAAVKPRT